MLKFYHCFYIVKYCSVSRDWNFLSHRWRMWKFMPFTPRIRDFIEWVISGYSEYRSSL